MKKTLAALGAVAVLALAGCGGGSDSQPGNSAVYQRIKSETNCATVQHEFDVASRNNSHAESGSSAFDATLGYMQAAQDRLDKLGC